MTLIFSFCLSISLRPSFCVSGSPSIFQCFFPFVIFICLSVYLFLWFRHFVCLAFRLSVGKSFHSLICLPVCFFASVILCTWQSVHLSVFPFIRHFVYMSVGLSVCLFLGFLHFFLSGIPSICQCFCPFQIFCLFFLVGWMCVSPNYKICLSIDVNHWLTTINHSVT